MPLVKAVGTERIALSGDGEWIEVKRTMGKEDERAIQQRLFQAYEVREDGTYVLKPGAGVDVAEFATLERMIVKWNIIDPTTKKTAVISGQNLRALSDEDMEIIKTKLNELYPAPMSEEEVKNSDSGSDSLL